MKACPLPTPALKALQDKYGVQEGIALMMKFDTPAFANWYGSDKLPFINNDGFIVSLVRNSKIHYSSLVPQSLQTVNYENQSPVAEGATEIQEYVYGNTLETFIKDALANMKVNSPRMHGLVSKIVSTILSSDNFKNIKVKTISDPNRTTAFYSTADHTITFNLAKIAGKKALAKIALHELVHAFTIAPFEKLGWQYKKNDYNDVSKILKRIEESNKLSDREKAYLTNIYINWSAYSKTVEGSRYFKSDPVEFVAELLSNRLAFNTIEAKSSTVGSIIKALYDTLLEFLGLSTKIEAASDIDSLFKVIADQVEEEAALPRLIFRDTQLNAEDKPSLVQTLSQFASLKELADKSGYSDGVKTFRRLTNFVREEFSKKMSGHTRTPAEYAALKIMQQNNVKEGDTLTWTTPEGQEVTLTFEDLVRMEQVKQNTGAAKGTLVHAMIEKMVNGDHNGRLSSKITDLYQGKPGEREPLKAYQFSWVQNTTKSVLNTLEFNFFHTNIDPAKKDKLYAEQTISSDSLGVATTIDLLVEHFNGDVSIVDWKTGGSFFKDELITEIMKHSKGYYEMRDNSVNRARLEIILRAFMLKEANNNLKFRETAVVHMTGTGNPRIMPASFTSFLPMIESYMKETNPAAYENLKAKGMFSPDSYIGISKSLAESSVERIIMDGESELENIQAKLQAMAFSKDPRYFSAEEREIFNSLTQRYLELSKGRKVELSADQEDIGGFKTWLGNKYSMGNPVVQAFINIFDRRKKEARDEINAITATHNKLLKAVRAEYYRKHPGRESLNKFSLVGGLKYFDSRQNGEGIFDFMWVKKTKEHAEGYYTRVITEEDVRAGRFTQAQYDYNKFYRDTMAVKYSEVMNETINQEVPGQGMVQMTKATALELEAKLPDDFAPRVFMTGEEVAEREGALSKTMLRYQYKRYMTSFLENELYSTKKNIGIPVKYLQNPYSIAQQNHTFSTEVAFNSFISNMVMKKYMDDVYSVGLGVKSVLEEVGQESFTNPEHFKNTIKFVDGFIKQHVQNVDNSSKVTRKDVKIPIPGSDKEMSVNFEKLADMSRSWVTTTTMWLKPIAGGFNALLITLLNTKEALKGSMYSEGADFTLADMKFAMAEYSKYCGDSIRTAITGEEMNNKLWNIAEKLEYLPDNYDYAKHKSKLVTAKHRMFDKSKLFMFHSIGEDMGQLTLLAAQLKRMKNPKTGKSLWDEYDENGDWQGGTRGVAQDGRLIKELTPEEVTKLKRVSQRIHGGYRQEERTMLEAHALGKWALQFKKYLPAVFENLFQGSYEDASLGEWVPMFDENGDPMLEEITLADGTKVKEPIQRWHARLNQGRVRVLGRYVLNALKLKYDPNYDWKNLQPEQKRIILDAASTLGLFLMMLTAAGAAFDDDEEDTALYRRYTRLSEDITQGYYPMDLLRSIQTQTAVFPKVKLFYEGASSFFLEGLIEGKTTQRGEIPGLRNLARSFPLSSTWYEWKTNVQEFQDKAR